MGFLIGILDYKFLQISEIRSPYWACVGLPLNRYIIVSQMEAHSEGPVGLNTLTCFFDYLMLYHCLWRWPNIETTLRV